MRAGLGVQDLGNSGTDVWISEPHLCGDLIVGRGPDCTWRSLPFSQGRMC